MNAVEVAFLARIVQFGPQALVDLMSHFIRITLELFGAIFGHLGDGRLRGIPVARAGQDIEGDRAESPDLIGAAIIGARLWYVQRQHSDLVKADYVLVRINYSPENKNPEVLAGLGYPQRFGFPVLVVLDQHGQRLHTQDTGLLELNKGYDPEKVRRFLLGWNRSAIEP